MKQLQYRALVPDHAGLARVPALKNAALLEEAMPDWQMLEVPAQPQTVAELMEHRVSKRSRSLNDDVDDIFVRLWANDKFRKLFAAIHPSQTVEGSFSADDYVAAGMIRAAAEEHGLPIALEAKLAAIVYSMHIVARRWGQSRNQRRNVVKGEHVSMNDEAAE